MTKIEIARRIADSHNRLANIFASGGAQLLSADSVILMGDALKDLRALAQQITMDLEAEEAADAEKEEKGKGK